jgi:hypothetical protein
MPPEVNKYYLPLLTAKIRAIACYDSIKIKTTGMGNYYDYS